MKKLTLFLLFLSLNVFATPYQPSDLEIELNKRLVEAWLEIEYQGFEDIRSIKNMTFDSATKDTDGGYTFVLKADVRSSGLTGASGGDDWWLEEYDEVCESLIYIDTKHQNNIGYDVNIKRGTCKDLML